MVLLSHNVFYIYISLVCQNVVLCVTGLTHYQAIGYFAYPNRKYVLLFPQCFWNIGTKKENFKILLL